MVLRAVEATVRVAEPSFAKSNRARRMLTSLPDVDIEAGHTVVILADPKGPSVVDRTSKGMIAGVDREYVDWYGDERNFEWSQVFNEVEYLAKPKPQVAMKE